MLFHCQFVGFLRNLFVGLQRKTVSHLMGKCKSKQKKFHNKQTESSEKRPLPTLRFLELFSPSLSQKNLLAEKRKRRGAILTRAASTSC